MTSPNILILLLLTLILFSTHGQFFRFAEGGKRRIHITDDLDDIVDDEEDEAWKQWGKFTKTSDESDPPPSDLSDMDVSQIQELMMKQQQFRPAFGFVKLRLGERRTPEMVTEIARKWTKVLRTGAVEVKFNGVDTNTIMFSMEKGRQVTELKEFILSQPEAYEIKIGDQVFRRPGDPPVEEVIEKLKSQDKADDPNPSKDNEQPKEEL